MSLSISKLQTKMNAMIGFSLPRLWVWLPQPLKTAASGERTVWAKVGSSQQTGNVVFVSSLMTNSEDDCDTVRIPMSLANSSREVDFPHDISPIAVGTIFQYIMRLSSP